MQALVFTKPGTVELLEVERPSPGPGETLVTVAVAGICGSEIHGIQSSDFRRPPLIMGHEFAGTTPDGRRVTVNPLLSCGRCDLCEMALDHLCRTRSIVGIHRPGAFAEYVVVPDPALHPLPATMSFERAALVEPLATAMHAINLARPDEGARIGILGAGPIGLLSLLLARRLTTHLTVCDLSESRLGVAQRLGAVEVAASLVGEFDVVVDAVGAESTHRQSVQRLRPGGRAVWVGLLSSAAGFDGQQIVREEKQILGSYCYTRAEFVQAIALAADMPLDWATSFDISQGATVFNELMQGRSDVAKALLHPFHQSVR